MAQIGNSAVGGAYFFDDTGFSQYMSGPYQMPSPGGYVTDVWVLVGGDGGIANGQVCFWDWGGALLYHTGNYNITAGSRSVGGQSWQHFGGLNIYLNSSGNGGYGIGFWTDGGVVWTYESSGVVDVQRSVNAPTTMAPPSTIGGGALGAYLVYTPLSAPSISNASPNVAPPGATVTVTGSNFLQVSGVTVCGVGASYAVNSSTQITLTVPAGASGAGSIVVSNPAGSGSIAFTAGQVYAGVSGAVHSLVAAWYGDPSGNGVPHKMAGIWVPNGAGTKRIW